MKRHHPGCKAAADRGQGLPGRGWLRPAGLRPVRGGNKTVISPRGEVAEWLKALPC